MLPFGFNPFAAMSDIVNQFMNWGGPEIQGVQPGRVAPTPVEPQSQCPHCGYQLSTFRQNGRLGCTRCYESFQAALRPLISSIHGNVQHVEESAVKEHKPVPPPKAPAPSPPSGDPKVRALREKLAEAIQSEKYEEAARLRDEIHKLEGN
jgi:protein arginine kinase activator